MARISAFNLVDLPEQPVLSVRATINAMTELTQWLGQGIDAVQGRLDELDARPAGAPFACFRGSDMTAMDVETGFPTAVTLTGSGQVTASTVPATRAVTVIDQGPYEASDPTLEGAMAWITGHGHQMAGPIYYHYLNDDSFPATDLLIEMVFPLTT